MQSARREALDPIEELRHRIDLRQKLEAAEREIDAGQVLTHDEVAEETARWFRE